MTRQLHDQFAKEYLEEYADSSKEELINYIKRLEKDLKIAHENNNDLELLLETLTDTTTGLENEIHARNKEMHQYIEQVKEVTEAAIAVENDTFEEGCLDKIAIRVDSLGILARVFQRMVQNLKVREKELADYNSNLETLVKQRTEELEIVNQELEAFNYSVAHDLRNPLGNIEFLIDLLKDEYQYYPTENSQKYLDLMSDSTTQMLQIINDLLMLSRIKKSELIFELVDLSDIVEKILITKQFNEPHRQVELIIESNISANVDKRFLTIVLENLVGNAWKYSSKKEITQIEFGVLFTEKQNLDSIINQFSLFHDKCLDEQKIQQIYFIKDNGAGFEMENAKELFTPFKRFHSDFEFEGIGIGLSIVQRIIDRHQGFIWCTSEVEKGTIFYFTLNNR